MSSDVSAPHELSVRTTDPLAQRIFHELRLLSNRDRQFVLDALNSEGTISSPKAQAIQVGLLLFQRDTGRQLSFNGYEDWRRHKEDQSLFSASAIVRHFGTWNRALGDLGFRGHEDPTALSLLSRGPVASFGEVMAALRACAAALGTDDFTMDEYRDWARRALVERSQPGPAIPLSGSTISKYFGSFRQAKLEAGLKPEVIFHGAGAYSRTELIDNLKVASEEVDGVLSTYRYAAWRKAKQREYMAEGLAVEIPCSATYIDHFGGWLKAVAIVEDSPERSQGHRGPPRYDPTWMASELVRCYQEIGEPFQFNRYQEWAKEERNKGASKPPPDYRTIKTRVGSWKRVKELLRSADESGNLAPLVAALKFRRREDD